MNKENRATEAMRRYFNRIAPFYDFLEGLMERRSFHKWRQLLWRKVRGGSVLEVGVGTGKNIPYYPPGVAVTAIDFSGKMLARARRKAEVNNAHVHLMLMDAQAMDFQDDTFDMVVATFVFCSVPDPARGLAEVRRVLKPGGRAILLEHVLSPNRFIAWWMNLVDPLATVFISHINRRTVEAVEESGLVIEKVIDVSGRIVKLIEARKAV